ncbi:MAG: AI-2E family transporter [Desulfobacterales bacterium]|nr:MAG: AI-2E family transporter [Desulfobacterales bacterium]
MHTTSARDKGLRILIGLTCFVVIVAGVRAAGAILVPFLLAVFIATICAPLLSWLQRHKIPTAIALIIIIIIIVALAIFLMAFVGSSITEFSRRLPTYQTQLQGKLTDHLHWLDKWGIDLSSDLIVQYFDPGVAMRLAANTLTRLKGILTNAFFILLTVIFILLEASSFSKKLVVAFGADHRSLESFDQITANINRYLAIKTLTSLVTGGVITLLLLLLGVDFPLLWGVLAFLLNYVPTIGSIIAAIPAILLAMIQLGMFEVFLACFGYIAVNVIIGSFIEPKLLGRQVGLSALVVFLSLVFWGWVLGPVGMILSVPLTMIVKIALEGSEKTKWLAILIGYDSTDKVAEINSTS